MRTTSVQGQSRPFTGESAPSYDADEHFLSSVSMPSHTRKCIYRRCRARGPPTPSCCASERMRLLLLCSKFPHFLIPSHKRSITGYPSISFYIRAKPGPWRDLFSTHLPSCCSQTLTFYHVPSERVSRLRDQLPDRNWGESFPDCYGTMQSPINLSGAHEVQKMVRHDALPLTKGRRIWIGGRGGLGAFASGESAVLHT